MYNYLNVCQQMIDVQSLVIKQYLKPFNCVQKCGQVHIKMLSTKFVYK